MFTLGTCNIIFAVPSFSLVNRSVVFTWILWSLDRTNYLYKRAEYCVTGALLQAIANLLYLSLFLIANSNSIYCSIPKYIGILGYEVANEFFEFLDSLQNNGSVINPSPQRTLTVSSVMRLIKTFLLLSVIVKLIYS